MSKDQALVCPICSLYLHPGVSLIDHLNTHSKQKVVELLSNLSNEENQARGRTEAKAVIETKNETHKDFHTIEIESTSESSSEPSASCSFIQFDYANEFLYEKDWEEDSFRSDNINENFENILIVIIVVAVIILYLKM